MEYIGIEPERVQFSWISAGEGERFADIITKITDEVKAIGPATRLVKGVKSSVDGLVKEVKSSADGLVKGAK